MSRMRYTPLPLDESARLASLAEYDLKADDSELRLDAIVQLASRLFDVPIALVSIVERERQFFSARTGLDVCETGRDVAFCAHALELDDILVVADAKLDPRFAHNPFVLGPPSYASMRACRWSRPVGMCWARCASSITAPAMACRRRIAST